MALKNEDLERILPELTDLPSLSFRACLRRWREFISEFGLKESARWLRLIQRVPLLTGEAGGPLLSETDELTRIFASSIRTAERNAER